MANDNIEDNSNSQARPLKTLAGAEDKPLVFGKFQFPCYVLEDEIRVISQRGLYGGLGTTGGGVEHTSVDRAQMPRFARRQWLRPFISEELEQTLKSPILFVAPNGQTAYGYPATVLPDICDAILQARDDGAITSQQMAIVRQADIIMRALAKVGIISLVDEATGYQEIRIKRALEQILAKFLAPELQPWIKTFPFEFYEQICRLKDWPLELAINRPAVVGRYTNDIVYDRLAPGLREELCIRNPALADGRRQHKHHQWLTPGHGHPQLQKHLEGVIALMRISKTWVSFKRHLAVAYPKSNEQLLLEFDDE